MLPASGNFGLPHVFSLNSGNSQMLLKSPVFVVSVLAVIMAGLVMLNPFGRNLTEPMTTGSISVSSPVH